MAGLVVPAASFALRAPARSAGTRSMARSQLKMDLPERTKKVSGARSSSRDQSTRQPNLQRSCSCRKRRRWFVSQVPSPCVTRLCPRPFLQATLTVPGNIGVGTLAWGDPRRGFGETYNAGDIMGAYNTLVEGGVTFFDTAEVYGYQSMKQEMSSEQLLGNFADTNFKYTPMIATKVLTAPAVSRAQHYPQSRPNRPTSTGTSTNTSSTNTSLPPH